MYDRIIVPLDGSPLAEKILPFVSRISLDMEIPVHLIRVAAPPSDALADPVHRRHSNAIGAGVHDQMIEYLNGVRVKTTGSEIICEAFEDDAVSRIVAEAKKSPSSLIAMSTHGRSGISRWLTGSVTDKVLHATKNPMLIVRGSEEGDSAPDTKLETVIVAVDGSPLAEQVIPHVVALALALKLKVILLRAAATVEEFSAAVGYQPLKGTSGFHFESFEEMAQEAENQALNYLKKLEDSLRERGVASVDHRIVRGPAAQVVVDVAFETPDSLVAMTTHGRSGPARWTLGSVTDRVVRHSGDPVLVVRASE